MLPKEKRLSTPLFKETGMKGISFHSASLSFKVIVNKNEDKSRFAATVSKKIAKSAVVRNKIRRRINSVIEKLYPLVKNGRHGIFFAKEPIKKVQFKHLEEEMLFLLKKSGTMIE